MKLSYSTYKIDTVVLAEIENICKINFGYMDEDSTKLINYIHITHIQNTCRAG